MVPATLDEGVKMTSVVALLLLLGCEPEAQDSRRAGDSCQWDTNCHQPEAQFELVSYGYDTASWRYHAELTGWTELVTLDISQDRSSPWDESWELVNTDYDPGGHWDIWDLELPIQTDWTPFDGHETLYPGTPEMEASMVWRLQAWWYSEITDCLVWAGEDADAHVLLDDGCRELNLAAD